MLGHQLRKDAQALSHKIFLPAFACVCNEMIDELFQLELTKSTSEATLHGNYDRKTSGGFSKAQTGISVITALYSGFAEMLARPFGDSLPDP
mmetsp:Transcript_78153/g.152900  ORF Transcript_78153/g.152900 Transcript_78153/m.152900 type:complete len:92 (+) Transcript_78153:264-539(+)